MRGPAGAAVYTFPMKTFLVPVDFSAVTQEIIAAATAFARAFGGKIILLHVIQPPIITSEYALPAEAVDQAILAGEQAANVKLTAIVKGLNADGTDAEAVVRHGPPVYIILEEAGRVKADYIIMGSHGHGRLYDLLVGSTASGVLKGTRAGVVILPPVDKTG
jgi:nucleotide-binding universal stress UspA family protein